MLRLAVLMCVGVGVGAEGFADGGPRRAATGPGAVELRLGSSQHLLLQGQDMDALRAEKLNQWAAQLGVISPVPVTAPLVGRLPHAAPASVSPRFADGVIPGVPSRAACSVYNMQGSIAGGFLAWNTPGGVLSVYVDPSASDPGCGVPSPYPFLIQSVDIPTFADASVFGQTGGTGTLEFSVSIKCPVTGGDPCSMPGEEIFRSSNQTLVADDSGFHSFNISVDVCVEGPFFVSIHWESWTGIPSLVPTPLWDAVARPLCQQWVSQNSGVNWTDYTDFFTGGDTGWVDIVVHGNTNDACDPQGNCGGDLPDCGDNVREGTEECDGTDDAACPGECRGDCTCPPTGACCVDEVCVATVTRYACSNGYDGVWHEGGDCANYPCVLPTCDMTVFDNGEAADLGGTRPGDGWDNTGIIDDFEVPREDGTEFTCIHIEMMDNTSLTALQTARIEIYALPPGGIADLGAYGTEVPVFDHTYSVLSDTLTLTDSGIDQSGYDIVYVDCLGTPFDLGAGSFGLLVTFPGTGEQDFWAASNPAEPGEDAYLWGLGATFPYALESNFAFELRGDLPPGACCDDDSGICSNGVASADCPAPLRFESGTTCELLDPPCGVPPGACCHDDGSCEMTSEMSCADNWLGAGTTCDQCPPAGACCVDDDCVATITEEACSNGYGGVWHEVGECPGYLCVPPDCNTMVFDNDAADGVGGYRPVVGWSETGIIDDFVLTEDDVTGFTCVHFEVLDNTGMTALDTARIQIYTLPPGGIAHLGPYTTEAPVFDQTYSIADGTLALEDSGINYLGYDLVYFDCFGSWFDLGTGTFGMLLTFPGAVTGVEDFWATSSPAEPGENGFTWGVQAPLPALLGGTFAFDLTVELSPGACCDHDTGICSNGVLFDDCRLPLRFAPDTLCAELDPPCSIIGACCNQETAVCSNGVAEEDCPAEASFYGATTCEALQPPCGYGGCCIGDGCAVVLKEACEVLGGFYIGGGDECDMHTCETLSTNGVCCHTGGICEPSFSPEDCKAAGGTFHGYAATCDDIDTNGLADICEFDCNTNGVLDELDLSRGKSVDCNFNGIPDECDLALGDSRDCNTNGYPDECDRKYWETEHTCFSGPGGGVLPGCECFDYDADGDVDLRDFAAYQDEHRYFGNVYLSNGTGGGDWFDSDTWDQNKVPGTLRDYDVVNILPGDTITQLAPTPYTLARYGLEAGAAHVFERTADLAALIVVSYGELITTNGTDLGEPPPSGEPPLGPGLIVVRNAVTLSVAGDIDIERQYDPNYCDLVDNAPVPFDTLGPCEPPKARETDKGDDQGDDERWANETTHRALTTVIVDNNQCKLHEFLVEELLLPEGIDTTATGNDDTKAGATATQSYAEWVIDGSQFEDEPSRRCFRHFLCPTNNAPMALNYNTALEWAFDGTAGWPTGDNEWDFLSAREYYFQALTESDAGDREEAFAAVFRSVGQILHLLEDMSAVPHVRDDMHPFNAPLEAYADTNFRRADQLNILPGVSTVPPAAEHPRYTLAVALPGFNRFSDWWDTNQYTGQATFTFGSTPGLAEYTSINFFSRDTVFEFGDNKAHPAHADTNLAVLFPPPANGQVILPSNTSNTTGAGWVDVAKTTPASIGIHPLTRLARARNMGVYVDPSVPYYGAVLNAPQRIDVSCVNNAVMAEYSSHLFPKTLAYGTELVNYFFRGKVELRLTWNEADGKYTLAITNRSGENLGAGTWHLYQDDSSGNRAEITADFSNYAGSLGDGASFNAGFEATAREGRYTLVFQGTLGTETDTAIVAKVFDIVRVHIIWDPKSDQDLYMWGPDGSLIWFGNLTTQFGELDNDDIGGDGPENITLKKLNETGDYVFMINYYRDWWREKTWDSDTEQCVTNDPPLNSPDDEGDACYTQTTITITVKTYHNSSDPVREVTRQLSVPNFGTSVPPRGTGESAVGDSWFVTQKVSVDDDGVVTVEGTP